MTNKEVKVIFWDHVKDASFPIKCVLWGKVVKETNLYLVVCYWDIIDDDEQSIKNNREVCCIMKSTIIDIKFV